MKKDKGLDCTVFIGVLDFNIHITTVDPLVMTFQGRNLGAFVAPYFNCSIHGRRYNASILKY